MLIISHIRKEYNYFFNKTVDNSQIFYSRSECKNLRMLNKVKHKIEISNKLKNLQNFFCRFFNLFPFEAGDGETPTYVPM